MDENGLDGYDLRFSFANPGTTEENWLDLNAQTGEVFVKESTPGSYNTAALNNRTIVKVDMYASSSSSAPHIATRYIKITYANVEVAPINVSGTTAYTLNGNTISIPFLGTHYVTGDSDGIVWGSPTTRLDETYNLTGRSAAQFHDDYTFVLDNAVNDADPNTDLPVQSTVGILLPSSSNWFAVENMNNSSQSSQKHVLINQNRVNPGHYTLTGRFVPVTPNSGDPVVNVTIKIEVKVNGTISYAEIPAYWENGAARVYGTPVTSPSNSWYLGGHMSEYIALNSTIAGPTGGGATPKVTYRFTIEGNQTAVASFGTNNTTYTWNGTYNAGAIHKGLGGESLHIKNADAPGHNHTTLTQDAFRYISGWGFTTQDPYVLKVKLEYFLNDNSAAYKTEYIPVRFKNPVRAITLKSNGAASLTDKNSGNNVQTYDVRNLFSLTDKDGVSIWNYADGAANIYNTTLINQYGLTVLSGNGGASGTASAGANPTIAASAVEFVKAYYASDATQTALTQLPQFTSQAVVVSGNATNIVWTNSGANSITQDIVLVYKLKLHNRYNDAQDNNAVDVEKEIKITIKPNPSSI
jgi:hypothetical protein